MVSFDESHERILQGFVVELTARLNTYSQQKAPI